MGEKRFWKMHVRGFDQAPGPGIPEGPVLLLVGPPGTMKSSLAYSFLWQNAKREGARGAYVTLEQGRESLDFQMRRMGMPREAVVDNVHVENLPRIPGEGRPTRRPGPTSPRDPGRGARSPPPSSSSPWIPCRSSRLSAGSAT